MVMESWFSRVGSSLWSRRSSSRVESEKATIGVLAFEVASLMSKVVHLWKCLSDEQVVMLRDEVIDSEGVRKLVSDDDEYLLGLVLAEIIDNLGFAARSVAQLGKKCSDSVLQGLEHVFVDLIKNGGAADVYGWAYTWKKMRRKVNKMERFVAATANLYQEMEVLTELEQTLRRMHGNGDDLSRGNFVDFQRKVVWQRQDVKHLRENSLWNRTFDYAVRLLARSLFTIVWRIKHVFGIQPMAGGSGDSRVLNHLPRSRSITALAQSSVHPSESYLGRFASGPLGRFVAKSGRLSTDSGRWFTKSGPLSSNSRPLRSKTKWSASVGPFKGCMTGGGDLNPRLQSYTPVGVGNQRSKGFVSGMPDGTEDVNSEPFVDWSNILNNNLASLLSSNRRLVLNAPPSTLGAAALAAHYASIIIIIEKLVTYPHLIAPDVRDDLYNMLPVRIRAALRARLKSYTKTLASSVYDANLAAEWNEALGRILDWLTPLAHNMIRWQSERNFEQKQLVSKTNVFLLETLFFADQAKTETVITELLVGLNYICRFIRS